MTYRVWYHPKKGDDYYTNHSSRYRAEMAAKKSRIAEDVVYKISGRGSVLHQKETPVEIRKNYTPPARFQRRLFAP